MNNRRKFKAVLWSENGSYGVGVEEHVDSELVFIASLYLGQFPNHNQARKQLIYELECLCKPGEDIQLSIPDYGLFMQQEKFPRFKIVRGRLKSLWRCHAMAEDAIRRENSIIEIMTTTNSRRKK